MLFSNYYHLLDNFIINYYYLLLSILIVFIKIIYFQMIYYFKFTNYKINLLYFNNLLLISMSIHKMIFDNCLLLNNNFTINQIINFIFYFFHHLLVHTILIHSLINLLYLNMFLIYSNIHKI